MKKASGTFEPRVFEGREVSSVTFYSNQVILQFGADLSVRVMMSYEYLVDRRSKRVDRQPERISRLMRLTDKRVAAATKRRDGTLRLRFEDGSKFACFKPTRLYEAYCVAHGGTESYV